MLLLRSLWALNEGRIPVNSFLGQPLLTHLRDRGIHTTWLQPLSPTKLKSASL